MNLFGITLLHFASLLHNCMGYFYPPLFWHKDNCAFRKLQKSTDTNITKEHFIKVVPYNGMNVVCPNFVTVNTWLNDGGISRMSMMENVWMVDKEGYDKCMVNEKGDPKFNKRILVCNDPRKIKYKMFAFHPRYNLEEPRFAPGHHYYFISTSRGYSSELYTRKAGGRLGHCEFYHMKLHIYVCDPKIEDCIWEMPRCDPPAELLRDMMMIDGRLPAPTRPPVVRPKTQIRKTTKATSTSSRPREEPISPDQKLRDLNIQERTTPRHKTAPFHEDPERICSKKDAETSIHLVLNFVLGGVALFMAFVIVILACGLARKSQAYKVDRPIITTSSIYEPDKGIYVESGKYGVIDPQIPQVNKPPLESPRSYSLPFLPKATDALENAPQDIPPISNGQAFTYPDVPEKTKTTVHVEISSTESDSKVDEVPV